MSTYDTPRPMKPDKKGWPMKGKNSQQRDLMRSLMVEWDARPKAERKKMPWAWNDY